MSVRAVFLDRDGTLIVEKHYLHRPEEVELIPGAPAALAKLKAAGFRLVIITNQSGVGRGYFSLKDVERVHARIDADLAQAGVKIDKYYVAPEAPDQPSRGRKPSPQFLLDARDELGIDLGCSYSVGDKLIDLQCGWNAGVKTSYLVRTGYGAKAERENPEAIRRAVVVDTLCEAAEAILRDAEKG